MNTLTTEQIRSFFEVKSNITGMVYSAKSALAAHHIEPNKWQQKVLEQGFVTDLELNGDLVRAEIEYSSQAGTDTETIEIPVAVLADCGHDTSKWAAWAKQRLEQEQQAKGEADRRRTEQAAQEKRERDLATLRELQAQYPEEAAKPNVKNPGAVR